MRCFELTAVGYLGRNPEVVTKGDTVCTRLCLIGNDYAGKDGNGSALERVTSIWFAAFGSLAHALKQNARKGDQLIVRAHIQSNEWTDPEGQTHHDYDFIVDGIRFGAPGQISREAFEARR